MMEVGAALPALEVDAAIIEAFADRYGHLSSVPAEVLFDIGMTGRDVIKTRLHIAGGNMASLALPAVRIEVRTLLVNSGR